MRRIQLFVINMLTNWLKTIDFVVASLRRTFINRGLDLGWGSPSTNVQSSQHTLPCNSDILVQFVTAGALRYIASATWHTGQSGCQKYAWGLVDNRLAREFTHWVIYRRGQVLSNAFPVEDVMAFGLNRILCKIIAQWTGGSFSISGDKWGCSCLAAKYKVWVTSQLSHSCQAELVISLSLLSGHASTYRLKMSE